MHLQGRNLNVADLDNRFSSPQKLNSFSFWSSFTNFIIVVIVVIVVIIVIVVIFIVIVMVANCPPVFLSYFFFWTADKYKDQNEQNRWAESGN